MSCRSFLILERGATTMSEVPCQVIELPVPAAMLEEKSANNGEVLAGVPHSRAEQ